MAAPTWSRIVKAIQSRLQTVPGVGKVHDTVVYTDEPPTGKKFQALFVENGKVNFCWITKNSTAVTRKISIEDSTISIVRGLAEVHYFHAMNGNTADSEKSVLELFDRIVEAFDKPDRTLGGVINTHALIEPEITDPNVDFQGIACHTLMFKIPYEYITTRETTEEVLVEEVVSGQYAEVEKVCRGLVDVIKPFVVPLVVPSNDRVFLGRNSAATERSEASTYPADPRNSLPRIVFRAEEWNLAAGTISGGQVSDFELAGSFWIQLKQSPGQDHQGRMLRALQRCSQAFLGNFNPAIITAIPGLISWKCMPATSTLFDELVHEYDDPSLRVSVGRVQIQCAGRIHSK